jgi:hypothetical protein
MKHSDHAAAAERQDEQERRLREAALDQTIAETFPASDPLSTNPNPAAPDDFDKLVGVEREWLSEK